jgi:hypothetical protein
VTFSLTPTSASGVPGFALTGYVVGTSRIQLIESQGDALGSNLGGTALGQGSNTDNFNTSMLINNNYVYSLNGADIAGSSTIAGILSFGASGALSGQMALNDFTNITAPTAITGVYTLDQTGRATLSNVMPASLSGANFTFQLYLDGNGNALTLGVDGQEVNAGPAYLQTATSTDFEGNYALAGVGFLNVQGTFPGWGAAGPVTVNADALSGNTDYTVQASTPNAAVSLTGTENSSTGALSLTGLNAGSFTTAYAYSYFRIDSSRVFALEVDGQSLGSLTLEGVSH